MKVYEKTNEYGLTKQEIKQVLRRYDDLKVQAMLFDMDIDVETSSLIPKIKHRDSKPWLTKWLGKQAESDYTDYDNGN